MNNTPKVIENNSYLLEKYENTMIMATWVRSNYGKLVKVYNIDNTKTSCANLSSGTYKVYYFIDLLQFEEFLQQFSSYEALILGIPRYFEGEITTNSQIEQGKQGKNLISRSKTFIYPLNDLYSYELYPNFVSILGFDYDVADYFTDEKFYLTSKEDILKKLILIMPFIDGIEILIRPSSSANICNSITGEKLKSYNGYHIMIVVANSTTKNIEKLVEYFKRSCWEHEFAIVVKDVKGYTDKYLFDKSVFSLERIWFEAKSEISVAQIREKEQFLYIKGKILNLNHIDYSVFPDYRPRYENMKKNMKFSDTSSNNDLNTLNQLKIKALNNFNNFIYISQNVEENIIEVHNYVKNCRNPDIKKFHELISQDTVREIIRFIGFEVDHNYKFSVRVENTKSCSIHKSGFIKDFGADDLKGNIVNFLMKLYDLKFQASFNYVKNIFGVPYKLDMSTNNLPKPEGFLNNIKG